MGTSSDDPGTRLDAAVAEGRLPGLHAVIAARAGQVVLERYYAGDDYKLGRRLGPIAFGPEVLHDLRSVSKSIVALLYGIALSRKRVPGPEIPLLDVFDYPQLRTEPGRLALTIGHALSMTMGIEWNENLPYTDPRNGEIAMEHALDRYRYVLSRPIDRPPGTTWTYCGGATALLGHLIARGSGMTLLEYAHKALLTPLGIEKAEWSLGSNGETAAASGLRLSARDLLRIGQCVAASGETVVPAAWIGEITTKRVAIDKEIDYGWHWYLYNASAGGWPWWAGFGNGGQRLYVVPKTGLVAVIFCGNYDKPNQGQVARQVWLQHVLGVPD